MSSLPDQGQASSSPANHGQRASPSEPCGKAPGQSEQSGETLNHCVFQAPSSGVMCRPTDNGINRDR